MKVKKIPYPGEGPLLLPFCETHELYGFVTTV